MLVRLMYASRATSDMDADALHELLRQCKENNAQQGITGLLCHCPVNRIYMQALEGGRDAVNRLYLKIAADPRHREVSLLSWDEVLERRFAGWAMGQVNLARLNPALLLKYSPTARLDPYALSAKGALALFDELVATASIMAERN